MERFNIHRQLMLSTICLLAAAVCARAVRITDITHIQGQRENRLMSIGLVVGLDGTGDGSKFQPAIRSLATMLQNFESPVVSLTELKGSKNVALVSVTAVVGRNGAREGENIDVTVSAIGSAKSLAGGELLITPMMGPNPRDVVVYGLAGGRVSADATTPTTGVVKMGLTMEEDIRNTMTSGNSFTLVIDDAHASWSMASTIAMTINMETSIEGLDSRGAKVIGPKNVYVEIPEVERLMPGSFIARIQVLSLLMPEKQARVTMNARAGTIVVDGAVTVSPVTITFRGMTISTEMLVREQQEKEGRKTLAGEPLPPVESVDLRLLVDSLEYLKAPFADRIAVIRELARSGNLHGKLIEQR